MECARYKMLNETFCTECGMMKIVTGHPNPTIGMNSDTEMTTTVSCRCRKTARGLFPRVKPHPLQWDFSRLHPLNCRCRLEKPHVGLLNLTLGIGSGGGVLRWSLVPPFPGTHPHPSSTTWCLPFLHQWLRCLRLHNRVVQATLPELFALWVLQKCFMTEHL